MGTMPFITAVKVDIATATNDELVQAWHAYATKISFHHADDTGAEWGLAREAMPRARAIETAIRDRGLERPEGQYLMVLADRINWETGEWSQNWPYAKATGGAA